MTAFDLPAYVAARTQMVQEGLDRFTPPSSTPPPDLHAAMRYSLLLPGKRIRPLLCMASAEAVGGTAALVLPTACALEMIHTFSLIHDDLPAIDDDDYRRGALTAHKKFGEAMAILAGDALHTLAFATILRYQKGDPATLVRVAVGIADASGTLGMVGGQVDDIAAEGRAVDAATLQSIHARKTGALLTASIVSGADLAGASETQTAALSHYGDQVGLAFQIVDDILDVTGDAATLGKPTGSDAKNDKATYPKVFGLDASRRLARDASQNAVAALDDFGPEAQALRAFACYIVERNT